MEVQAIAMPETTPETTPEMTVSHKDVFEGHFNLTEPSNFKVKLKSEAFDVHKEILAKHCVFFDNAGNGPFKEASTGIIDLCDDDPDAMKAVLQFCYTGDYTPGTAMHAKVRTFSLQPTIIFWHLKVYALAEKYNMKELKDKALLKFEDAAELELKSQSAFFPAIIGYVYDSTPPKDRGLRDLVINITKRNLNKFLEQPEFESMMEENGDFGKDLVKAIAVEGSSSFIKTVYQCPHCNRVFAMSPISSRYYECPSCNHQKKKSDWSKYKYELWVGTYHYKN